MEPSRWPPAGSGWRRRAQRFLRAGVDLLHGLRPDFPVTPVIVADQRQDAGKRTQAHGRDEDQREDDVRTGPKKDSTSGAAWYTSRWAWWCGREHGQQHAKGTESVVPSRPIHNVTSVGFKPRLSTGSCPQSRSGGTHRRRNPKPPRPSSRPRAVRAGSQCPGRRKDRRTTTAAVTPAVSPIAWAFQQPGIRPACVLPSVSRLMPQASVRAYSSRQAARTRHWP